MSNVAKRPKGLSLGSHPTRLHIHVGEEWIDLLGCCHKWIFQNYVETEIFSPNNIVAKHALRSKKVHFRCCGETIDKLAPSLICLSLFEFKFYQ